MRLLIRNYVTNVVEMCNQIRCTNVVDRSTNQKHVTNVVDRSTNQKHDLTNVVDRSTNQKHVTLLRNMW